MIRFLLRLGLDVDVRNKRKLTPLHSTLRQAKQFNLIKLFLEHGADVNATLGHNEKSILDFAVLDYASDEIIPINNTAN